MHRYQKVLCLTLLTCVFRKWCLLDLTVVHFIYQEQTTDNASYSYAYTTVFRNLFIFNICLYIIITHVWQDYRISLSVNIIMLQNTKIYVNNTNKLAESIQIIQNSRLSTRYLSFKVLQIDLNLKELFYSYRRKRYLVYDSSSNKIITKCLALEVTA